MSVIVTNQMSAFKNVIEEAVVKRIEAVNKETLKYVDNKNEELSKNIDNNIDILLTEVAKLERKNNRLEYKLCECKTTFYIVYVIFCIFLSFSLGFNIINFKMISQKSENQTSIEQITEEAPIEEISAP